MGMVPNTGMWSSTLTTQIHSHYNPMYRTTPFVQTIVPWSSTFQNTHAEEDRDRQIA